MHPVPDTVLRLVSLTIALVFAWSAVAKILRFADWSALLRRYGLPRFLEAAARLLVPVSELAVAAALLLGALRLGAAAALLLLAAFFLGILRARSLQGDKLPCGCFGKTKTRDYRLTLFRNGALGLLSGIVLLSGEDGSPLRGLAAPSGSEIWAVPAIAVGIGLIGWMLWSVTRIGKDGSEGVRR
jgi:uncharacterized membrane protein YphA (DoxX/SURF4 family)